MPHTEKRYKKGEIICRPKEMVMSMYNILYGSVGIYFDYGTPEQVDVVLRGRPLGADTGHGIGLKNVLARLRLHFGGESNLLIESVPGQGTRITIRLPWQAVAPQTTKEELSHDPNPDCR